MATPTTLKEFIEQQRDRWTTKKEQAQQDLTTAQSAVADTQGQQAVLVKEKADLELQVAEKRTAMAEAAMPADADALLDELGDLIVQLRRKRSELLDAEDALAEAEADLGRAGAELASATRQLSAAELELADAEEADERRQGWKDALGEEPLSTVQADATSLLSGSLFNDAKARIESDVPAKLRDRAVERGEQQTSRLAADRDAVTGAEDLLDTQRENDEGPTGAAAKLRRDFERKEAAFSEYVLKAKQRYDLAEQSLQAVTDSPPLTSAVSDQINDAALTAEREEAVDKEKARDDALAAVEAKQAELEAKELEVLAADVDADVEADPDITNLQAELNNLETTLATAENDFTQPMRDTLDAWEASVPERTWADLLDFETAEEILHDLKTTSGTALRDDMVNAEQALTAALVTEDKSRRTREALEEAVALRREQLVRTQVTQQRRVLGAVRGDQ